MIFHEHKYKRSKSIAKENSTINLIVEGSRKFLIGHLNGIFQNQAYCTYTYEMGN